VAVQFVADIAAGLGAAHRHIDGCGRAHPIIHRDVSPHNVLVSIDGTVKLADFGLARPVDAHGMTKTGQLKGKVTYMAPEQLEGAPEPASDVFAAGLILFVLLTLKHPLQRASEVQSLRALITEDVPDVRTLRPEVPAAIADVVARATQRDPRKRLQDGVELHTALESVWNQGMPRPSMADRLSLLQSLPVFLLRGETSPTSDAATPTESKQRKRAQPEESSSAPRRARPRGDR
jgi:serine/threonine protein kinase